MATPQVADDYSFWLTKQSAAEVLDVSTKTVEKFHDEGAIQGVSWRRPGGGPKIMVYHPGDIEALRAKRQWTPPSAHVTANLPSPTSENGLAAKSENLPEDARVVRLLGLVLEKLATPQNFSQNSEASQKLLEISEKPGSQKPRVDIKDKVWLTVAEAAAYYGRPQSHVRKLIADGILVADREGYTRVRRRDLEAL